MILTITMNPAIDISYKMDNFEIGKVNRVEDIGKTAGGKGLNVTRVLAQLGEEVIASGLLGGSTGESIKKQLITKNIKNLFFEIAGETRNCIAILHNGTQTEILEAGPTIRRTEGIKFLEHFENILKEKNIKIVAISGSLPKGLEKNYYSEIIKICNKNNISVVLDCSGKELEEVLKNDYKPMVIKPNTDELAELVGSKITDLVELKKTLNNKIFIGIEWIIVSLGKDGAFAKHNEKFYKVNIPKIKVKNPVGSGDSSIAGITSSLSLKLDDEALLKRTNTLGMLNAMESETGYINLKNYYEIFKEIEVIEI